MNIKNLDFFFFLKKKHVFPVLIVNLCRQRYDPLYYLYHLEYMLTHGTLHGDQVSVAMHQLAPPTCGIINFKFQDRYSPHTC